MSQPEDQGKGGRYNRSANGLIASLVVTVLAIGAFVIFTGAFRRDVEVGPEPVDYLETVAQLQSSDFPAVYPGEVPEGWIVSAVDFVPGESPEVGFSLFTDDEKFVGIRQAPRPVDDLLDEYVDPDRVDRDTAYDAPDAVAPAWEGWSDQGGDHAYTATIGEDTVIVFGSASTDDLQQVVDSLTTDPVPTPIS